VPASASCGGIFDYDLKRERLEEVNAQLEAPDIWSDPKKAQDLGREKKTLETVVEGIASIETGLDDSHDLFAMARDEDDAETVEAVESDVAAQREKVELLEFRRMFSGELDSSPCFVEIQSGAGGTEAQDWAQMLLRQYLRYCERKGFQAEVLEESEGETAGIKGATIRVDGDHAYGHLRTETGVHRLVRKSPFGAGDMRQTSFASVYVYPEVDDSIEIEINPADLRIDVFRASGAGGQHVNKTESAVRITHLPTNIVVQCQNDRSQHRNKDEAMTMLRSRLYEHELRKRQAIADQTEAAKSDIGWGHQIRSYILDKSLIKDLRTNVEVSNTKAVLDGDLDTFITASLKQGV
jgi:peptide chain release factor 2